MSREIEPSNLVFEPRYEERGTGKKAVNVVYTPEGEYLLDVEVTNLDEGTHYSFVMDAGVFESDALQETVDDSEIKDVKMFREGKTDGFIEEIENPGVYEANPKIIQYVLRNDAWDVNLEEPTISGYPAQLNISGCSDSSEDFVQVSSRYASHLSSNALSQSNRYGGEDFVLEEVDLSYWDKGDWSNVIQKAVNEAIGAREEAQDQRSLDD